MPSLGGPELLIIAVVVLIVFGAGRLPNVLGQLGKGVRDFRASAEGKDEPAAPVSSAEDPAPAKTERSCAGCGKAISRDAQFCPHCGSAVRRLD